MELRDILPADRRGIARVLESVGNFTVGEIGVALELVEKGFGLKMHSKICSMRQHDPMVDIAGLSFGENLLQRNIDSFPILGMDDVKKRIKGSTEVLRPDPNQTTELGRGGKLIGVGPPFPVSDLGNPLSQPKA